MMLSANNVLPERHRRTSKSKVSVLDPDSDPETYHDTYHDTNLDIPPECPTRPFPSPSPALMQFCTEFDFSLVLPPPYGEEELEVAVAATKNWRQGEFGIGVENAIEEDIEGELEEEDKDRSCEHKGMDISVYNAHWEESEQGKKDREDFTKSTTETPVDSSKPPPIDTSIPQYLPSDEPSTSQCPTPRPRSVIGVMPPPPTQGRFSALNVSARSSLPVEQLSRVERAAWKADFAGRKKPYAYPLIEAPARGKWVWMPDPETPTFEDTSPGHTPTACSSEHGDLTRSVSEPLAIPSIGQRRRDSGKVVMPYGSLDDSAHEYEKRRQERVEEIVSMMQEPDIFSSSI